MLRDAVDTYVALRRVTGFKFRDPERMLRGFAAFAAARGDEVIRAHTAVLWAEQAAGQRTRHWRLRLVTRLAEFLRAEDPRHELPPQGVFCSRAVRPLPHVFSEEDIARIVAGAAQLGPSGSLRPLTYSTLFGLIAVTGLRISEALALRLRDVTGASLTIRESKFRKSRCLPRHATTAAALQRYLAARDRVASRTDHLFISLRRTKLSPHTVRQVFHDVCERIGCGRTLAGTRPRVHDLRHDFTIRALERCPAGRDRVTRHMLALSTYLGHAQVASTYWYLERTPQLLRDIAAACDARVPGGAP